MKRLLQPCKEPKNPFHLSSKTCGMMVVYGTINIPTGREPSFELRRTCSKRLGTPYEFLGGAFNFWRLINRPFDIQQSKQKSQCHFNANAEAVSRYGGCYSGVENNAQTEIQGSHLSQRDCLVKKNNNANVLAS